MQDRKQQKRNDYRKQRLVAIQFVLAKMKKNTQLYLADFNKNSLWQKMSNELLFSNEQSQLNRISRVQLCPWGENTRSERCSYHPKEKLPVQLCYNRIGEYEDLQKALLYNLILHYDNVTKALTDWNNLDQVMKSSIRGLHLAGICKKGDKKCFLDEVEKKVMTKERFEGMKHDFDRVYQQAIEDMSPINYTIA